MEEKIIAALDRLTRVFQIILREKAKEKKLSPIQIQSLIYLLTHREEQCRVSYLAKEFDLKPATMSEVIKTLIRKGLVSKEMYKFDKRGSLLKLTKKGRQVATSLINWQEVIKRKIEDFPFEEKERVLLFLMELIVKMQEEGIISIARMCICCRNFRRNAFPSTERPHLCELTGRRLRASDLKFDCLSYQVVENKNFY